MTDTDVLPLGEDLLFGGAEIAEYLGLPRRKVYFLLNRNRLPAAKQGDRWVSSRAALRSYFQNKIGATQRASAG